MATVSTVRPVFGRFGPLLCFPNVHGKIPRIIALPHLVSVEELRNAAGDLLGTTVHMVNGQQFDTCLSLADWINRFAAEGGAA